MNPTTVEELKAIISEARQEPSDFVFYGDGMTSELREAIRDLDGFRVYLKSL